MNANVVLAVVLAGAQVPVQFPGTDEDLRSPDGRYVVRWSEPTASGGEHRLLLSSHRATVEMLRFGRSVLVSWSPDSHRVAVTNRTGSDESGTLLYHVSAPLEPKDACGEARERIAKQWSKAHHRYCEVVRWSGHDRLVLRLHGYGEGVAFDDEFTVRARP